MNLVSGQHFFVHLLEHHLFEEVCWATQGHHEMNHLLPGTHPAAKLHNQL
jgi:hypothetical protein